MNPDIPNFADELPQPSRAEYQKTCEDKFRESFQHRCPLLRVRIER